MKCHCEVCVLVGTTMPSRSLPPAFDLFPLIANITEYQKIITFVRTRVPIFEANGCLCR